MAEMDGYWEDLARPWLDNEAVMEALTAPTGVALDDALALQPGEAVLDIGPGSGASLMRFAAAVGSEGRVTGVDIAPPFAARAAERSGKEVVVADAGSGPVEEGAFDVVASQLGMMFFEDPTAAFAQIGRNLKPGGRLVFIAWGPRAQNPLFSLPAQVATAMFGPPPPVDPDAPGPFGLHNASRTLDLLAQAGFDAPTASPVSLMLRPGLDAAAFAALQTRVGPAAGRLRAAEADDAMIAEMTGRLTDAFGVHGTGAEVALPALMHIYAARWPG